MWPIQPFFCTLQVLFLTTHYELSTKYYMLIDGKKIAQNIYESVATRVEKLSFKPIFCDVLVGEDPASKQYVAMKARVAEKVGIEFLHAEFASNIQEDELIQNIIELSRRQNLCGLIVQLPLPAHFNRTRVLNSISPQVDVDCLSSNNLDLFYSGKASMLPPTPAAVLAVLDTVLENPNGKTFVVVGQGELVGKPVSYLLEARGYKVKRVVEATENPESVVKTGDVVISATGKPQFITASWIQPGAIVIDAGTAENAGSIVGDVETSSVSFVASYLSPTPGGVGPVTVAKLLENVVNVAEKLA